MVTDFYFLTDNSNLGFSGSDYIGLVSFITKMLFGSGLPNSPLSISDVYYGIIFNVSGFVTESCLNGLGLFGDLFFYPGLFGDADLIDYCCATNRAWALISAYFIILDSHFGQT